MAGTPDFTPKGVVATVTTADGYVVAHAADFNQGRAGGFTQQETQKARLRDNVAMEFIKRSASSWVYDSVEPYDARQILGNAERKKLVAVTFIPVGYDDDEE